MHSVGRMFWVLLVGFTALGRVGSLPAMCELKCVSVLPMVGVWILPRNGERDFLMTLTEQYRMCNNYSGTQVQVNCNRLDTSILRPLN